jgi:NADPH:quinone reductase-like Zn-dependent oxidoreductase
VDGGGQATTHSVASLWEGTGCLVGATRVTTEERLMKAVVYSEYGPPEVLRFEEVEKPVPKGGELLVRVHAASVNQWDWDLVRGMPLLVRLGGLRKPQHRILGADIAGVVEAVGRNVTRFQLGDEVFGDISGSGWGGFAEYAVSSEDALAPKPAGMSFEDAAAVPQAGVLALEGLRKESPIGPGSKVLINGAGGGVGTFAVQIAKAFGAEVTGVDRSEKLTMVASIGADRVIDYTQEDFTRGRQGYDLILDVAAHHSAFDCERALNAGGTYTLVGGSTGTILQVVLVGPVVALTRGKNMSLLMHQPNKDLTDLTQLLEAGRIAPVIDKRFPLSKVAEAVRYLGEGHARGKVVITV